MELQVHFFARRGCRVGSAERVFSMGGKLYHGKVGPLYPQCRAIFEVLNGGALHPDYDLTLKPASGYMLRAYSTRTMEKRGAITREEVAFHTVLSGHIKERNFRAPAGNRHGV